MDTLVGMGRRSPRVFRLGHRQPRVECMVVLPGSEGLSALGFWPTHVIEPGRAPEGCWDLAPGLVTLASVNQGTDRELSKGSTGGFQASHSLAVGCIHFRHSHPLRSGFVLFSG